MHVNANLVHQRQAPSCPQIIFVPAIAVPQYAPAQSVPQQDGMPLGSLLAGLTAIGSGLVLADPKASKEAKAAASWALGVSGTFLLNKVFDLQAWPVPPQRN
jgi:hypothetical protein